MELMLGVRKSDPDTVHILGHVAACLLCDVVRVLHPQHCPSTFALYPDINIVASHDPMSEGSLNIFTPLFNRWMSNTKILAISSPCSSFRNYTLQRNKHLHNLTMGEWGWHCHFDFHKINLELSAMTLCSSELNTTPEVRAVLLTAFQLSFHIMLRKSLDLIFFL